MITESQRNDAAEEYAALKKKQSIGRFTEDDLFIMRFAHMAGQSYATEQLQSKWIPCKHKDILPTGRYALYVFNPQTEVGCVIYETIGKFNREIRYFFVTHYCAINLPEPPKQ